LLTYLRQWLLVATFSASRATELATWMAIGSVTARSNDDIDSLSISIVMAASVERLLLLLLLVLAAL